MKGLLLAGGHGTRLRPLTSTGNKHTLPIANKPMILYGLEHLTDAGIDEVGVVLGPLKEEVVELLGDGSRFGVKITYIDQPDPKGLAHTIMIAEEFLDNESFVMYLGDNILRQSIKPLIKIFKKNRSDCVIAVKKVENPSQYGVAVFRGKRELERVVEKPKKPISNWAIIGVYLFNEKIFDAVSQVKPSLRGELEITDAIQTMLNQGSKVDFQFIEGWWKDIGCPEDLLEANRFVLRDLKPSIKGVIEAESTIVDPVTVGVETVIHHHVTIKGPVAIGDFCDIGPNVDIGSNTSIGDGVIIRNGSVDNSIIMNRAYIDYSKRITESIIGRQAKIVNFEGSVSRERKLIIGDRSYASI